MTPRHFAWQAWHNLTSTFVLHGRRGTISHPPSFCVAGVALMGLHGWRAWAGLVADDAAALCVAGVAQPHIHLRFAWQAWHNLTSAFVLRGRRGTHGTGWRAWAGLVADDAAALCVAGVAQSHIHLRFARGRRGTISHPPSFCVAGVALMGLGGALGPVWSRMTPRHFAWQAWHNLTSTFVSRGRCGTIPHPPSFCVAGVALGDIHLRFAWQAWHLANIHLCFVTYHLCHTRLCHTPSFTHHL